MNSKQFYALKYVKSKILKGNRKCYLVGGAIRDVLLDKNPKDFDLATDATKEELENWFPEALEVGKSFGIFIIPYKGTQIEIAQFRKDISYKDGRRPDKIVFSTPQEDALRRDFTINGIFLDLETGNIIDYVNGYQDIQNKILTTIGNSELRFSEDFLRMLRAIRFSCQLNFKLDHNVLKSIIKLKSNIQFISKERISNEIEKILSSTRPTKGIYFLELTNLKDIIKNHPSFPQFDFKKILDPNLNVSIKNLFTYVNLNKRPILYWTFFLQWIALPIHIFDLNEKQIASLCDFFCLNKNLKNKIVNLIFFAKDFREFIKRDTVENFNHSLFKVLLNLNTEEGIDVFDCLYFAGDQETKKILDDIRSKYIELININGFLPEPLITGHDLISYGYKPGQEFKQILDQLYLEQLKKKILSKEDLFKLLNK